MKSFTQRVQEVVKGIPKGKTLSYQQVAQKAGSPKAYRVVGSILKKNTDTNIPCHRVIKNSGDVGKYNMLQGIGKKELLEKEGYREIL